MRIISFGWGSRFGSPLREGQPYPIGVTGNQPIEDWWFTVVVRNFDIGIPDCWEYSPDELECDFDQHIHGHWDTVTPGGLIFPGADGRGRAFVQTRPKRS